MKIYFLGKQISSCKKKSKSHQISFNLPEKTAIFNNFISKLNEEDQENIKNAYEKEALDFGKKLHNLSKILNKKLPNFKSKKLHNFLSFDNGLFHVFRIIEKAILRDKNLIFQCLIYCFNKSNTKKKILRNLINYYKNFRIIFLSKYFNRWVYKNMAKIRLKIKKKVSFSNITQNFIQDKMKIFEKYKKQFILQENKININKNFVELNQIFYFLMKKIFINNIVFFYKLQNFNHNFSIKPKIYKFVKILKKFYKKVEFTNLKQFYFKQLRIKFFLSIIDIDLSIKLKMNFFKKLINFNMKLNYSKIENLEIIIEKKNYSFESNTENKKNIASKLISQILNKQKKNLFLFFLTKIIKKEKILKHDFYKYFSKILLEILKRNKAITMNTLFNKLYKVNTEKKINIEVSNRKFTYLLRKLKLLYENYMIKNKIFAMKNLKNKFMKETFKTKESILMHRNLQFFRILNKKRGKEKLNLIKYLNFWNDLTKIKENKDNEISVYNSQSILILKIIFYKIFKKNYYHLIKSIFLDKMLKTKNNGKIVKNFTNCSQISNSNIINSNLLYFFYFCNNIMKKFKFAGFLLLMKKNLYYKVKKEIHKKKKKLILNNFSSILLQKINYYQDNFIFFSFKKIQEGYHLNINHLAKRILILKAENKSNFIKIIENLFHNKKKFKKFEAFFIIKDCNKKISILNKINHQINSPFIVNNDSLKKKKL